MTDLTSSHQSNKPVKTKSVCSERQGGARKCPLCFDWLNLTGVTDSGRKYLGSDLNLAVEDRIDVERRDRFAQEC